MGIHGIYKEIGPGKRIALSKLSVEHYIAHSRPLRIAIDISIWLFQIQAGQGGSNPALRTFYYRLLRLLTLNIHPLFVFDGPNKPLFKRNKRVGGPNVRVSSIPEFLAKQLLKQFGFPMHVAPGEAEAECALLQREGLVDAVLSEDVDTLMFGSGLTMRSWTPEMKSSKVPTHINLYDAKVTKEGSGMDREGMILVALMSGGDYIPEGIPGCGPKTACDAAKAGFGQDLVKIGRKDNAGYAQWRERLQHELWTNQSKFFRQKKSLTIPDDFPNKEVLGYYTHPCVSGPEKIARLRETLKWDQPLDFPSLRTFAADAFDWRCISGAKKFIRNLAPAMLIRELRLRAEQGGNDGEDLQVQAASEARLVTAIHSKREHISTDKMTELRISFVPLNLVDIDLTIEDPDEELSSQAPDSDSEAPDMESVAADDECPASPSKKRGPSTYDPTVIDKMWIMDAWVRHGAPLKVQDWEASFRDARLFLAAKAAAKEARKGLKAPSKKAKETAMPKGALDRFTKVSKPGITARSIRAKAAALDEVDLSGLPSSMPASFKLGGGSTIRSMDRPASLPTTYEEVDLSGSCANQRFRRPTKRPSPEPASPLSLAASPSVTPKPKRIAQPTIIDLLSSSPQAPPTPRARAFTPPTVRPFQATADSVLEDATLPQTVTRRRKRSPFKRHHTAPVSTSDGLLPTPSASRSSTPPHATIEELDLASTDLPSPSQYHRIREPANNEIHGTAAIPFVLQEARAPTPPVLEPLTDIPSWIRRSQSMTPSKNRHIDFPQPAPLAAPIFELSDDDEEDSPEPIKNPDKGGDLRTPDAISPRPTISIGVGALLPQARRLKERTWSPEKNAFDAVTARSAKSAENQRTQAQEHDRDVFKRFVRPVAAASSSGFSGLTTADLTTAATATASSAMTELPTMSEVVSPQRVKNKKSQNKRFVMPRESLEGAWKEVEVDIESVDLSGLGEGGAEIRPRAQQTRWRRSAVEVLDLTGD